MISRASLHLLTSLSSSNFIPVVFSEGLGPTIEKVTSKTSVPCKCCSASSVHGKVISQVTDPIFLTTTVR
ncbi:hypothetical protein PF005_g10033 [Phytophthora fragariae]|uniref:Uncharacterized protein n=1 Tax=Phytophthora fragariae TaxID=53985 RepID=A0A6A3HAY1_9STRA|nr:hypothetical protein PF003_g13345 [Phytophthora fragariae]KAE8918383.1 hypothetical protein PF009_g31300 [Phytophthora fragariae]KAE8966094.1 hypothetical protein PF011_g28063 [Phytophthora fragariae]KAE9064701.1 hypothetical protein PF007_g29099 [Phytophthora fragariae]KAE9072388.1 hypothetical protein PF006_g28943 [Phytophthora fragariae]